MASDANTGSAMRFGSRVLCSSDVAIGAPTTARFKVANTAT
jgi:hypothetical protein